MPEEINKPELKLAMAKLLPKDIQIIPSPTVWDTQMLVRNKFFWIHLDHREILETEWLLVMQIALEAMNEEQRMQYCDELRTVMQTCFTHELIMATFNQRATAMCKVKGIKFS